MKKPRFSPAQINKIFLSFSIAAGLVLTFALGCVSIYYKWPPYEWVHDADMAYQAVQARNHFIKKNSIKPPIVIDPAVIHKPGASDGYTLLSSMSSYAILVDMDGRVVHAWHRPFSQIWPHPTHIAHPLPDNVIFIHGAWVFPNGDLLATFAGGGDTPYGYGLAKLDKDSRVIWKYSDNVNHIFDIDKNGNIYALTHAVVDANSIAGIDFFDPYILEDSLVILDKNGHELKRVSLLKALINSPYKSLLEEWRHRHTVWNSQGNNTWDITHTNSPVVLRPEMASAFPMFKPGQVLISMRNLSMIGVLDVDLGRFVWAKQGPWSRQHDAEFVADGTIMLFDNKGAKPYSRILSYNPGTDKTEVIFTGTSDMPFRSNLRGMQQRLPNGDLLLTEAEKGRVIEVNSKGEIVWSIIHPFLRGTKAVVIGTGFRYTADQLPFLMDKPKAAH